MTLGFEISPPVTITNISVGYVCLYSSVRTCAYHPSFSKPKLGRRSVTWIASRGYKLLIGHDVFLILEFLQVSHKISFLGSQ
jgi:hypothetical protein